MTNEELEAYARIRAAYRLGLPIVVERDDGARDRMRLGDRVSNVVRILSVGIERDVADEVFTSLAEGGGRDGRFASGFVQRVFDACPYNDDAYRRHVGELAALRLILKLREAGVRNDPALRERYKATMVAFLRQRLADGDSVSVDSMASDPNDLDVIDQHGNLRDI